MIAHLKCKKLCILVIGILLCQVNCMIINQTIQTVSSNQRPVCLKPICVNLASEILSKIDYTVNPCDNFYQFACNQWIQDNHIPRGHTGWSIFGEMSERNKYFLKALLEEPSMENEEYVLTNAKMYYRSCLNTSLIEQRGFAPLYSSMENLFGGWYLLPSGQPGSLTNHSIVGQSNISNLFKLHQPMISHFGSSPFFSFGVSINRYNSSQFLFEVSEGSLSLPKERYTGQFAVALQHFMRNYSLMLGVQESDLNQIDEIYEFESEIASLLSDRYNRNVTTGYEITNLYNLTEMCPVINWIELLQSLYSQFNYTIDGNQTVALDEADSLRARCQLHLNYTKTPDGRRKLRNSVIWSFLWRTVYLMPRRVQRALQELQKVSNGIVSDLERWDVCARRLEGFYDTMIGRQFIKRYFDEESENKLKTMVDEVKISADQVISNAEWMQPSDREKALLKVKLMEKYIGYPNLTKLMKQEENNFVYEVQTNSTNYFEISLLLRKTDMLNEFVTIINGTRDRWNVPFHIVNAFYSSSNNRVYLPAGISQRPFFNSHLPDPMNFGSLGVVIGHEMTHAFDDQGSQFDEFGNVRSWWSNKTRETFQQKLTCMENQYSNYSILGRNINGNFTIGENVADNGGLKLAYNALHSYQANNPEYYMLPGLNYTSDQLFFLGFAQTWCSKQIPQAVYNQIEFDVHSVAKFRVIGSVSNLKEFSEAFNCPSNSPMNPVEKCGVW